MISYTNYTLKVVILMNLKRDGKYAWTVKIGEKGQFVIPKEGREMLGIKPGDTILVLGDPERGIAIPPKQMMDKYITNIFNELSKDSEENL